jgi:tRNA (cytidine/uridine-2'-O-)-methyltransferase
MTFSPSAQKALNALCIQAADGPAAPALGKGKCGDPAAFIGTLTKQAQARPGSNDQRPHNSFAGLDFRVILRAMRIALYEPDIPQNTGTILRLTACLGLQAHIIEPTGFPSSDRAFRRAGMDYLDKVALTRHVSWAAFDAWRRGEQLRLLLFTTAAERSYLDHAYRPDDILLFGRESSGVPETVHQAADVRLKIPMRQGLRSLNVAVAAAMAAGELIRQLGARLELS